MARDKKSMIGFDPLAWLDSDTAKVTEEKQVTGKKTVRKDTKAVKKSAVKSTTRNKTKMITVLGHSVDEIALMKGYELASKVLDEVIVDFYDELFNQYPGVKPLFDNTTEQVQASKFATALNLLVGNLNNEEILQATLVDMGKRHQGYGALPEHYPIVIELLIANFKKQIGRSWTKAISAAWLTLLEAVAETMCAAYTEEASDQVSDEETIEVDGHTSEHPVLHLNSVQDISKSQALKNDMMALINDNDEIDIDAEAVERIDGTALQLLCAFFVYAKQNSLIINWIKPSDALLRSAETLGVQDILELV